MGWRRIVEKKELSSGEQASLFTIQNLGLNIRQQKK